MSDCLECEHAIWQHWGPGQACSVLLTPGERCRCNHFRDEKNYFPKSASQFIEEGRGDCFNIAGDPEQLCTFVRLAARAYSLDRTEENLHRWRELLAELMLNEHVDERWRLTLLFEYCRDIGPDVDMFKGDDPDGWGLGR